MSYLDQSDVIPRYKFICCEILFREACQVMATCESIIDPVFLPKELHDVGAESMSSRIQRCIDDVEVDRYDAILLGYGLCNNGVEGLKANIPLVIPRVHDCIGLLMGSCEAYLEYFQCNPGTFFKSPGWVERDIDPNSHSQSITSKLGMDYDIDKLTQLYGEENADFLKETLGDWLTNYQKITYIDTGTGNAEKLIGLSKERAVSQKLDFEVVKGSLSLIDKLFSGQWQADEFLVLPPDQPIEVSHDEKIFCNRW